MENLKIEYLPVGALKPYARNTRKHGDLDVKNIAKSIEAFGMNDPIGIWGADNTIVEGHGRLLACKRLGMTEVPCVRLDHLTDEQRREYAIAHNATAELSEWDKILKDEIADLDLGDFDFDFGFGDDDEDIDRYDDAIPDALRQKFIAPPFSVLDARGGAWQKRKKEWCKILQSENGRDPDLLGAGLSALSKKQGDKQNGTSIFDPVLCEVLINWFSPRGGKIIDPFAGGSVRGVVSSFLQREYYGNDLRKEQIDANEKEFEKVKDASDFWGKKIKKPNWSVGDSANIDEIIDCDDFDMLLTCPPYADLEKYSDDKADLSNMEYSDFLRVYKTILEKSIAKLKENAFICVVVGEVRDKRGYYRNFIGETIKAVEETGAKYYNEIILVTMGGTLALRAGKVFEASRKVGNTHQKALIFLKSNGDENALQDFISSFDATREILEMKQSILVFLKGNSKLAKSDIEAYLYDPF